MTAVNLTALVLLVLAVAGLAIALYVLHNKLIPHLKTLLLASSGILAIAALSFLSFSAGTGTLFPQAEAAPFEPALNGTHENQPTTTGNTYTGAFKDGYFECGGTITYPDGSSYTGQWRNNLKDGQGTQSYVDERGAHYATYSGTFVANKRTGQGSFTYSSGEVISGRWQEDSFMG